MTVALVPVKRLEVAKQRLASVLSPEERVALMLAMLRQILEVLPHCRGIEAVAVVTADPRAAALAAGLGAEILPEPKPLKGESAAVAYGARVLAQRGVESMLVLPADLPQAEALAIERLVAEAEPAPSVRLARAFDGGTNALLARPPEVIPFLFGPESLKRHKGEARRLGIPCQAGTYLSLLFDIDTPEDLAFFVAKQPGSSLLRCLSKTSLAQLKPLATARQPRQVKYEDQVWRQR